MTELLMNAIEKAKSLPLHRQDEVGRMLLDLVAQDKSKLNLSSAQQDEIRSRLANTIEWVPEDEMDAFFSKLKNAR